MIRHRIRYVLIIPVTLAAIFTLGTIIFPLYQQGPNFVDFYKNQPSVLYISPGENNATSKVIIQNEKGSQTLDMTKSSIFNLPSSISSTISLIASSTTGDENAFILLPEGTIIQIRPQSEISFLSQYPKIFITTKQGQVAKLPSDNYSPWQIVLSGVAEQDGLKNQYQQAFEQAKLQTIGTQTSTIFMQNSFLKSINKGILNILVRLRPTKFEKNIKNFNDFEMYIPTIISRQTDTSVDPKIQQDMINQAGRGWEETQIYKRWKNIFK
ncbi:MAG: hypothetical protein NTX91_05510 [candidate division SR1 bacterium]|nr:hypothetical protein [candidate division SR1 bacterium]